MDIKQTQAIRYFVNQMCDVKLTNSSFPAGQSNYITPKTLPMVFGYDENKVQFLEYTLSYEIKGEKMYLGCIEHHDSLLTFIIDQNFEIDLLPPNIKFTSEAYKGTLFDVMYIAKSKLFIITDTICIHGKSIIDIY